MQEFSSISVSSYEAGSLAERLTEQSRDGWQVVAIVPTGSSVTAYLARASEGRDAAGETAEPLGATSTAAEPAPEDEPFAPSLGGAAAAITPEPASEPAPAAYTSADLTPGFGSAGTSDISSDISSDTSSDTPSDTSADLSAGVSSETTTEASAATGAAPAGWYADPSSRYELRYWDGGQWTEHVSRAGQQYTDPPVA
jgi:hypothetical protein